MSVDTSRFLENLDLKNIYRAYTLAYLRSKNVVIKGTEAQNHSQWNLGSLDEGYLIKTEDNALFSLNIASRISKSKIDIEKQIFGGNLHESFLDIIATLIAKKHKTLPQNKLKIALCISHMQGHWTTLLAQFDGLNGTEYKNLFNAYQRQAAMTKENVDEEGNPKDERIIINNVRNFIMGYKNITLPHKDSEGKSVLGNYVLPINVKNVSLTHYDSMGTNTRDKKVTQQACAGFAKHHGAKFTAARCAHQRGMTCGDWSAFNAFSYGVLAKKQNPTSIQLRKFAENITVNNANQILFANKPNLTTATARTRVCITKEADESATFWENQPNPNNPGFTDLFKYNDPYLWTGRVARLAVAGLAGYGMYLSVPFFVTIGLVPTLLAATTVSLLSATTLFNAASNLFFGQAKIDVKLAKNKQLTFSKRNIEKGISDYLGIDKPHHKTLQELEQEISTLLTSKNIKDEKNTVLTHYYTKQIVNKNPDYFYDCDKTAVASENYVNAEKVKQFIRTPR